jgi:hypothetical protein
MIDRKKLIHDALLACAKRGEFPFYSEFAKSVGVSPYGPWKDVLDAISKGEIAAGRPDITFVLRRKDTKLPGQIGFRAAKSPTSAQRMLARKAAQDVIDQYCPAAANPF